MRRTYFSEEQYFSNFWFWVFLVVVFAIFLIPTVVPLFSQLVLGTPYGENPENTETMLIISGVLIVVYALAIILFRKMKLVVEVKNDGVYYRYLPFIMKFKVIRKEEISRFEIRKYKAIKEYSGWGINTSWAKWGKAFTVKGNTGLQLYLRNGNKILFGTQRPEAIKKAMHKMMQ